MAINKPTKPSELLPRSFGGIKNNFSEDLQSSGFEANVPQTYNGDNLNYQLDTTGKELDYCEKVVDYINGITVGKTPIVDANNRLNETEIGLKVYNADETYNKNEWVIGVKNDRQRIFKSLQNGNKGNSVTNILFWEEVNFNQNGFNLFDTKTSDHILEGEEAQGWALQGTYIYKEGVSGLRNGYPDFYGKCVKEKNIGIPTEIVLGENTIVMYVNSNGHTFYNIADKEKVDAFFNTTGLAWFYGVDEENERIFLPRNNWFEQLTVDTSMVGSFVEAGLPDHNHTLTACRNDVSYVDYDDGAGRKVGDTTITTENASVSNSIYGNSDTVQPNAIKKLLYICVGTTSVKTAVTNVVEVTTTENDTIPLFTSILFDFKPNNVSWLKGGEQANSGGVYETCYETLLSCLEGDNPYEIKVIEANDMLADVDYSEYWIVNKDLMFFITPEKNENVYFKVANVVENLEIIDVGKILEQLSDKIGNKDCSSYLVEVSDKSLLPSWYRIYSDGWCEQGSICSYVKNSTTVSLLKQYKDNSYYVSLTDIDKNDTAGADAVSVLASKTISDFVISTSSVADGGILWEAKGYIS